MKKQSLLLVSLILCFFSAGLLAESGDAATGMCKDGTPYTGASKKGACRGHKGLKEWYGDKADAPKETSTSKPAKEKPAEKATAESTGPATGLCKDGTEYTGASKKGACRGHKGLKEWYADKETPTAKKEEPAKPVPAEVAGVATGLCKDGTEYTGASKRGACRGHKGLKEWYADKAAPAAKEETPVKAAPATASEGVATGLCNDGTEYTGTSKRGACRGHKGVKEWYADKPAEKAKPAATVEEVEEASEPAPPKKAVPAPAAGSGKVWVNTNSKIYHCEGSKFYGNTKEGEYMSESDAQTKGFRANRNKACN